MRLNLFYKYELRGWCDGACLESELNTHAKCFSDAIEAHGPGTQLRS